MAGYSKIATDADLKKIRDEFYDKFRAIGVNSFRASNRVLIRVIPPPPKPPKPPKISTKNPCGICGVGSSSYAAFVDHISANHDSYPGYFRCGCGRFIKHYSPHFRVCDIARKEMVTPTPASHMSWSCEHCGKFGRGIGNYARYHGNNCRRNPTKTKITAKTTDY